jgi:hypothetical protein
MNESGFGMIEAAVARNCIVWLCGDVYREADKEENEAYYSFTTLLPSQLSC